MKKLFLFINGCIILFSLASPSAVSAQDVTPDNEGNSGAVVCTPDVYLTPPDDCLPIGPSTYLTEMAKLGLTFPPRPFLN
jgi:hypothetical protein